MWGLLGLAIALTFSLAGWIVRLLVRGVTGSGGGRARAAARACRFRRPARPHV